MKIRAYCTPSPKDAIEFIPTSRFRGMHVAKHLMYVCVYVSRRKIMQTREHETDALEIQSNPFFSIIKFHDKKSNKTFDPFNYHVFP
jgi:hypothetical protein